MKGRKNERSRFSSRLHEDAGDQKLRTDVTNRERGGWLRDDESYLAGPGRRSGRLQEENHFVIDRSVCSRICK